MTLDNVQRSTIESLQEIARVLLETRATIEIAVQQYYNELYPGIVAEPATITDADIVAYGSAGGVPGPFAHISTGEIVNAVSSLQALQTWGGDLTSGNWGNLLRLLAGGVR